MIKNLKEMKKEILFQLKWLAIVSLAIYLMLSFINWDITIIKQIPTAKSDVRTTIVFVFIIINAIIRMVYETSVKPKK